MKKILFIVAMFAAFAASAQVARPFNNVYGKQDFKDSIKISAIRNNETEDSILTIDYVTNKLKLTPRPAGALAPDTLIFKMPLHVISKLNTGAAHDSIELIAAANVFEWGVRDSLSTPAGGATVNQKYLVGTSATGSFATHSNQIAVYDGSSYTFNDPTVGDLLYNAATAFVSEWTGAGWVRVGKASIHQGGDAFGVDIVIGSTDGNSVALAGYGSGVKTGTQAFGLGIDNTGKIIEVTPSRGGISKVQPGRYQTAQNDSTTNVDSNYVVIKDAFFNPNAVPFANASGILTHAKGALEWVSPNLIIGPNDASGTWEGVIMDEGRARMQGGFGGMRMQVGITGDTDPTKEYNLFNSNNPTPYLRLHSTGTGPYKHFADFNTSVTFKDLSTDSVAPVQSGTPQMVTTDKNGRFSFQPVPVVSGDFLGKADSTSIPLGHFTSLYLNTKNVKYVDTLVHYSGGLHINSYYASNTSFYWGVSLVYGSTFSNTLVSPEDNPAGLTGSSRGIQLGKRSLWVGSFAGGVGTEKRSGTPNGVDTVYFSHSTATFGNGRTTGNQVNNPFTLRIGANTVFPAGSQVIFKDLYTGTSADITAFTLATGTDYTYNYSVLDADSTTGIDRFVLYVSPGPPLISTPYYTATHPTSGGTGGTGSNHAIGERFTASTSTTLTLAHTYVTATLAIYKNGARLDQATDFTPATATTLTLLVPRLSSDIFLIDYLY